MDKFSLFDFLSFLLPGSMLLIILSWLLQALFFLNIDAQKYPGELLLVAGIAPSYFLGLLINKRRLLFEFGVECLTQMLTTKATTVLDLNNACKSWFDFEFIEYNEGKTVLNDKNTIRFLNMAYDSLTVTNNTGIVYVLYSQAKFLYNLRLCAAIAVASSILILLQEIILHGICFCKPYRITVNATESIALCITGICVCYYAPKLAKQRSLIKLEVLLKTFDVFYRLKTKKIIQD